MAVATPPTTYVPVPTGAPPSGPRVLESKIDRGDRYFRIGTGSTGVAVLALMAAVGIFLSVQAAQALSKTGLRFLTTEDWQPDRQHFGIAAVMSGTVIIAMIAVAVALPVAMGSALFITEVAPARLRSTLVALVDLMAAIPSVVYGLWGAYYFQDKVLSVSRFMATWFAWIPIFKVDGSTPHQPLSNASVFSASAFIAGLVVALMVIPIQCSVMREVFSQVPLGEREGALALGSTRWGMIRSVSIPFGQAGIIGGTMLGLGRALGETIAVVLIISPLFSINFHVLQTGTNSVSSLIALRYGEASGFGLSALFAAGLALFLMTLGVNYVASIFIARSRSGASSEA